MPFDPLLGVGYSSRSTLTPVTTILNDASLDITSGASPASNSSSVTIPSGTRIYAVSITLSPEQRSQTCVNGIVTITIDGKLIAKYLVPTLVDAATPVAWQVNEILPYSYDVYGGAQLSATLSADNGGATGYIMQVNVTTIGLEF